MILHFRKTTRSITKRFKTRFLNFEKYNSTIKAETKYAYYYSDVTATSLIESFY